MSKYCEKRQNRGNRAAQGRVLLTELVSAKVLRLRRLIGVRQRGKSIRTGLPDSAEKKQDTS